MARDIQSGINKAIINNIQKPHGHKCLSVFIFLFMIVADFIFIFMFIVIELS